MSALRKAPHRAWESGCFDRALPGLHDDDGIRATACTSCSSTGGPRQGNVFPRPEARQKERGVLEGHSVTFLTATLRGPLGLFVGSTYLPYVYWSGLSAITLSVLFPTGLLVASVLRLPWAVCSHSVAFAIPGKAEAGAIAARGSLHSQVEGHNLQRPSS